MSLLIAARQPPSPAAVEGWPIGQKEAGWRNLFHCTSLGDRLGYLNGCLLSVGILAPILLYSTAAGSRKSKVWVANNRVSGRRKKLRLGTNRWPVRPHRWLLRSSGPQEPLHLQSTTGLYVTTRGPTVSVASPGFPFPIPPSMSHVALSQVSSSSSIANQPRRLVRGSRLTGGPGRGFICGSVTLICRWPRLSSPILLTFLHLWFHLALFCSACPDSRFHQDHHLPPQSTPQNGRLLPNWPPCPLPVSKCSLGRTPTMAPG